MVISSLLGGRGRLDSLLQQTLRDPVACAIRVVSHAAKQFFHPQPRAPAEIVRERNRLRLSRSGLLRPRAGGGHGEQLRRNIHETSEQQLLALQLGTIPRHRMKQAARQPAAAPLHKSQVSAQRAASVPLAFRQQTNGGFESFLSNRQVVTGHPLTMVSGGNGSTGG